MGAGQRGASGRAEARCKTAGSGADGVRCSKGGTLQSASARRSRPAEVRTECDAARGEGRSALECRCPPTAGAPRPAEVRVPASSVRQIAESVWMRKLHMRAEGPFVQAKAARVCQIAESAWMCDRPVRHRLGQSMHFRAFGARKRPAPAPGGTFRPSQQHPSVHFRRFATRNRSAPAPRRGAERTFPPRMAEGVSETARGGGGREHREARAQA